MHIDIQTPHFTADKSLIDFIKERVQKVSRYYDHITDVTVYLKLENAAKVKDKLVELKMAVPGDTLITSATDKSFEAAFDSANDSMIRQIKRYKGKRFAKNS
jgi:putative sigma-54 modulation protein